MGHNFAQSLRVNELLKCYKLVLNILYVTKFLTSSITVFKVAGNIIVCGKIVIENLKNENMWK